MQMQVRNGEGARSALRARFSRADGNVYITVRQAYTTLLHEGLPRPTKP